MTDELVLCYSEEPGIAEDLVRVARAFVPPEGGRVVVTSLSGPDTDPAERLSTAGADQLHTVVGPAPVDPHAIAETLRPLLTELSPTVILIGGTKRGKEVAGRLAGALDLPSVTGVTGLRREDGALLVDREALSGNAVAVERIVRRPAIVAMLPGTTAPAPPIAAPAERKEHAGSAPTALTEVSEVRPKAGGQLDIEKAERIVTIGRGLKRKEDLGLIDALAKALKAEVGCTRPLAAEAGWLTDDHWIGLTGHRVRPKLYVAVGVSGAVQHLVGMRSSQIVVALNKDPNAPIFSQADYRIVGDLYQIVPALTKAFAP